MPTAWGTVESVVDHRDGSGKIGIRTRQSRHGELSVSVAVSARTLIAKGIRCTTLADIRVGEFVEWTSESTHHGGEAESVYVRPEPERGQRVTFGVGRERAGFGLCGGVKR